MAIKSRITKATCVTGSGSPPTASTDGFFLYDNLDIVSLDTATTDINPLRASFTKTPSLIGRQLYNFSGKVFCDQHDAGESIRYSPLLECCALDVNKVGESLEYTPQSTSLTQSTLYIDLNGVEYQLDPAVGTFTMAGTASEGVEINFDLQAVYNAPVATTNFGSFDAGPSSVETLKGITASITPSGGSTYNCAAGLILKSFSFTRGVEIGERPSACATNGLAGLDIVDSNPTLELVVEMPDLTTNLGNYYSHLTASTTHAVSLQWGSNARGIWKLDADHAQVTNIDTPDGDAGNRNLVLSYKLTDAAAENGEFKITVDHTQ